MIDPLDFYLAFGHGRFLDALCSAGPSTDKAARLALSLRAPRRNVESRLKSPTGSGAGGGRPGLAMTSANPEPADDGSHDHQGGQPIATVDQEQTRPAPAEGVIHRHGRDDEAEPAEGAGNHPVLDCEPA